MVKKIFYQIRYFLINPKQWLVIGISIIVSSVTFKMAFMPFIPVSLFLKSIGVSDIITTTIFILWLLISLFGCIFVFIRLYAYLVKIIPDHKSERN